MGCFITFTLLIVTVDVDYSLDPCTLTQNSITSMCGNSCLRASGQKSDLPFAPATAISYNKAITLLWLTFFSVIWRRNSVNTSSGLKTDFTIVFSDHDFQQGGQTFDDIVTD